MGGSSGRRRSAAAPHAVRQIIRTSLGGSGVRIRLSNLFGTAPLKIGPVHVAAHASGSAIQPETDHAVTFGGKATVTIAKGADALSDPVTFSVHALEELAVSLYLPVRTGASTVHVVGTQTAFITPAGDATVATMFPAGATSSNRFFLTDVEVAASATASAIVAVGDSITDGDRSTQDQNARWPDALAARLQADPALRSIAVVNAGISGNRILNNGFGPSALARFERDALSKPHVRWILLLEGINDIGVADASMTPEDEVSAQQVIDGMKICGATLTPFGGAPRPYQSVAGETKRRAVNAWIRTAGAFDAVVDFEQVTRDPAHPDRFLPAFDSGDHLHPSDAGYKAMAASIDLRLFTPGELRVR